MFESLIGIIGFIALVVVMIRQQNRLNLMERELGALRSLVLSMPPQPAPAANEPVAAQAEVPDIGVQADAQIAARAAAEPAAADIVSTETASAPAAPEAEIPQPAGPPTETPWQPAATSARKPDIETALGTRWAVWVGGIALALGGIFLVRYTIEAGFFGPAARLTLAGLFGAALVAGGEFIRRTGFKVPVEGAAAAYIPAILTAAGAFTLFGTVYSAHGIYGFIGPAPAFLLMGLIGVATIAAALVHGQALAGVGLLGSLVTPVLVSSQSPNAWALFGYLAIVLVSTAAVARLRRWTLLVGAAFAGTGLWCLLYMADAPNVDLTVVMFIQAVMLGALAFVWLGNRAGETAIDWASVPAGLFAALAALALFVQPGFKFDGGIWYGTVLIAAMVAVALLRAPALPLLFAAGAATFFAYLHTALSGSISVELFDEVVTIDGFPVLAETASALPAGLLLSILFLGAGLWSARRFAASLPWRGGWWAGWAVAVPLAVLTACWIAFGNLDVDYRYAFAALVLAAVLTAGGEWIARAEEPAQTGGPAVSFALAGAGLAGLLFIHMAFGSGLTTVLAGAAAVLPALATRQRTWPVLGWLSVGSVIAVMARVALDPTIVGAASLSTTPMFNWLLPGYGIPALAFAFCAWQLARTTGGRPRLVMEAGAVLFALLTAAMLTRHAMNGGVIDASEPTLAEQAIYTLLALGAGAILVAIDMRSPSSVLRYGSIGAGVVSAIMIVLSHFLLLNPLFTEESTGSIPVFNLLFLGYLLPAAVALGLAWYARDKRPRWYSAMLALIGSGLAFAYATLSVRRLFKGEFIGLWRGMEQLETYSYSALWLALGVALLVAGVRFGSQVLRIASAALITIAVAKVFLFDMSELEGVLRALSFIGLGAVLIGIGLFYQRLLTRAAAR